MATGKDSKRKQSQPAPEGPNLEQLLGNAYGKQLGKISPLDKKYSGALKQLMSTHNTVQGLLQFAQSQGYDKDVARDALGTYLTQSSAYGKFDPESYTAPTKANLLSGLQQNIGQAQANSQQKSQQSEALQYAELLRQAMHQRADSFEQGQLDKISRIQDPNRQNTALAALANLTQLSKWQADQQAYQSITNPYSAQQSTSLPQVLAGFNQGQSNIMNKLYGGASNAPGGSNYNSQGAMSGNDAFTQALLGGGTNSTDPNNPQQGY